PSSGVDILSYRWNNLTIQPGQTIILMHFALQNAVQASAVASAQRLVQLPPEALAGLASNEILAIQNFAVPADGSSPVPPLTPPALGTVSGKALAVDGLTALSNVTVKFQSGNLIFGKTASSSSDANGAFTLNSVPIDTFSLQGTINSSQFIINSPSAFGSFAPNQTTASQNIVFSNTGLVHGTVTRNALPITSAVVEAITSPSVGFFSVGSTNLASDGTYVIPVLLPGSYRMLADDPVPQGDLFGSTNITVVAGQITPADIAIQPTGTVTGLVVTASGAPASGLTVSFTGTENVVTGTTFSVNRSVVTDASGHYTFNDVPTGTFTLTVREPNSGVASTASVIVAANQTTTAPILTLTGLGTIQVQLNFANGSPAANAEIDVLNSSRFLGAFSTDATGKLTVPDIPVGTFTLHAFNPNNRNLTSDSTVTIVHNGDVIPITMTLQPTGVITGRVS